MTAKFFDSTIGEQLTLQRGFDITKKQQLPGNVPVVSSGGISSYHNEAKVEGPGVVLGRKGSLGTVFYLNEDYWPHDTSLWVKDFKGNNPRFVYYFFKSISESLKKMDVGAANPALNRNHVHPLSIKWVVRDIQNDIVKILSSIDNKIDLNHQVNQTLEEMAQTIFKSWFVDFEPVKAKIEAKEKGQDPECAAMCAISGKTNDELDQLTPDQFTELAATAALFPYALVGSELGLIPKGWRAGNVGNIVTRLKPKKRYTKKQVVEYGSVPVYEQGASILLGYHNDEPGFNGSPEEPLFIFGDHTCVCHLSCAPFDISQNVIPLSGKKYPTLWVYYAVKDKQKFQEYRRHWSELIIKKVIEPEIEICQFFSETVTKLYQKKEQSVEEDNTVRQLRDTLLPKLLSGEIELKQNQ